MPEKLNVYSVDLKLCGTAYIRASSERAARKIFRENFGKLCAVEIGADDVTISNRALDSERLPEASLSGTMTCYGQWGSPFALAAEHVNKDWEPA
jgi:hypothetical protein